MRKAVTSEGLRNEAFGREKAVNHLRLIQGGADAFAKEESSFSHAARQELVPANGDVPAVCMDQILRRQFSEERLRAEGLPIDKQLPVISGEAGLRLPTSGEIADRTLALAIAGAKGSGIPQVEVERIIDERGAYGLFTPHEQDFIDEERPSPEELRNFSWRYEAAWTLMWALRHFDGPLGIPAQRCDADRLMDTIFDVPDLARRRVRTANEILNEADLAYRCHVAALRARQAHEAPPARIDPVVAHERHHALSWLLCHDVIDWDDLTAGV